SSCVSLVFRHPTPTALPPLSLHDALPIYDQSRQIRKLVELLRHRPGRLIHRPLQDVLEATLDLGHGLIRQLALQPEDDVVAGDADRKSTRLNSSHQIISYAVFCLKQNNYE